VTTEMKNGAARRAYDVTERNNPMPGEGERA
jgi:hypothetical protein